MKTVSNYCPDASLARFVTILHLCLCLVKALVQEHSSPSFPSRVSIFFQRLSPWTISWLINLSPLNLLFLISVGFLFFVFFKILNRYIMASLLLDSCQLRGWLHQAFHDSFLLALWWKTLSHHTKAEPIASQQYFKIKWVIIWCAVGPYIFSFQGNLLGSKSHINKCK